MWPANVNLFSREEKERQSGTPTAVSHLGRNVFKLGREVDGLETMCLS